MNTRRFLIAITILMLTLSACAAPAAPTVDSSNPAPLATVVVEQEGAVVVPPVYNPGGPVSGLPPAPTAQEAVAEAPVGVASQATAIAPYAPGMPAVPPLPGYGAPPQDNYFHDYGVNPFEDPREDRLSTFALDVDTASYSVARRYVTDGYLPPSDAVRVEEFVNYFDPGYHPPADVAFAVYADGAPSPFHHDGSQLLRVGVQGHQVSDAERLPASLTFVVDISGSMEMENRLGLVKRSLELLVERLRPNDSVSIVVYGSQAYIALQPTSGEDKGRILEAIYSLRTEGATNAEAGLRLGYQLAYQNFRRGAINRVILCSDGVANVGETGPAGILEQIRGYTDAGITLTTIGFGMGNFNDVLMEQLADNGDGSYAYVDDLDEAQKLFVENLSGSLQVIAKDAKIQVDFNPDVVARYRLIGYENRAVADQDFRNDNVDAGEIGAGHSAVALYAILLHPGATGRIATVQLRWQEPDSYKVTEINGNVNTWDLSQTFDSASAHFQLAAAAAQYAELLRYSPSTEGASLSQLLPYALRLPAMLPGDADVYEFASLVQRAAQIGY